MTGMLDSFSETLLLHDTDAHTHCRRVAGYALILGRRLGLSKDDLTTVELGVFLHDIGKIHVPDRILKKTDMLSDAEWKIVKNHTITGYAMLSVIPSLAEAADIVLAHHERYNGMGYPHRLEGQDIPLGARICAVADCLDALTSPNQIFRRATSFFHARQYIASERKRRFDPGIVDAFLSIQPWEWRSLQDMVLTPHAHHPHENGDPPSFREMVFSGHFDKPARTVVAC